MKKLLKATALAGMITTLGGCVLAFVGCSSTKVNVDKDGAWSVEVDTDWLKRELQSFHAKKSNDGVVEVEFNGYKHDTSEQLAKNAAEFWGGIAVLGRLAGTVFNPAVASVPLGKEAANAADTAALVTAAANAEAAKVKAKADAKAAVTAAKATATCPTGTCTDGTCPDCTDTEAK